MGNRKTPGHRGFLFGLTTPVFVLIGNADRSG